MSRPKTNLKKLNLNDFNALKSASIDQKSNRLFSSGNRKQSESLEFIRLTQEWEKIVGQFLSKNSNPLKIFGKTLIILTRHSIFSQELSFMSEIIISKVSIEFPKLKNKIDSLKFQVTPDFFIQKSVTEEKITNKKNIKDQKFHQFSPKNREMRDKINKEFAEISDPEMKELLTSLFLQNMHDKD